MPAGDLGDRRSTRFAGTRPYFTAAAWRRWLLLERVPRPRKPRQNTDSDLPATRIDTAASEKSCKLLAEGKKQQGKVAVALGFEAWKTAGDASRKYQCAG